MPISPSRKAAFDVLHRVCTKDAYAADLLHSGLLDGLSAADRALATEITMGVLRWQQPLENALTVHLTKSSVRLDHEVRTALLMGAYQLVFLNRIPASAAVNDSVALVKRARKHSAAGLVNAVLRKIADDKDALLERKIFDTVAAHPAWLVERWSRRYGEQITQKICAFDQQVPVTAIRCTRAVKAELGSEGVRVEHGHICRQAWRVAAGDVTATKAFREGRVAIQDEASQLVALLLEGGARILDCCAAPGGKTALIAERNRSAKIVATELHEHRFRLMRKRVRVANVEFLHLDARQLPAQKISPFDRVLADMPCSGTGTLARNPEIKWRLKPEDLTDLAGRQREILRAALECVAPGGTLVYSTCSLEPEENEQVIEDILKSDPRFALRSCRELLQKLESEEELVAGITEQITSGEFLRTIPGVHDCDGFFAALICRI